MHHDVAKYHCFMDSLSIYPYSLDIDECTDTPAICGGHTCSNTEGSYECICSLGCMNGANPQTCIGNNNDIINAMK